MGGQGDGTPIQLDLHVRFLWSDPVDQLLYGSLNPRVLVGRSAGIAIDKIFTSRIACCEV